MTTSRMSLSREQMEAWLLLEGWEPQDMGYGAFNTKTHMYVNGTHTYQCKPDGGFAQGNFRCANFDPKAIQMIYARIIEEGL